MSDFFISDYYILLLLEIKKYLRVLVHLPIQVDRLSLELLEDQVGRSFQESLGFLFHLLDQLHLEDLVDRPFLAFLVYPLLVRINEIRTISNIIEETDC